MRIIKHIKEVLSEENKEIEIIPTGYSTLDNLILGMRKRELALFASTPGIGKTAMLLNLALNMAKKQVNVIFITLETTATKISEKFLGILSNIDPVLIEKGNIPENLKINLEEARQYLSTLPLYVSEEFLFTKESLKEQINEITQIGIDVMCVDSLQFIQYSTQENTTERDIENIRFLKNLARQNNISILISTQINSKNVPQGKTPTLLHIGGEEELADMVFILHRPYAYSMDQYVGDIEEFVVQLAKNRNGPSGSFKLMFSRQSLKIDERKAPTL